MQHRLNPVGERGIDPFDAELAITWPPGLEYLTSPKDAASPSLAAARAAGVLPTIDACNDWYRRVRAHGPATGLAQSESAS